MYKYEFISSIRVYLLLTYIIIAQYFYIKAMYEEIDKEVLENYKVIRKVGSGAYGHVWKIEEKNTGKILALKKIFGAFKNSTDAQRTFREIFLLDQFDHPHIIKLIKVLKARNKQDIFLLLDYMEADLHQTIRQKILQDCHIRYLMHQVLQTIKFIHSSQVVHRDLKPSNILINSDCHLKISDFGLARSLSFDRQGCVSIMTQQIATRWYRAPEILLGSESYGKAVDIWSLGCILGEIYSGEPMFPGQSLMDQLQCILTFTGRPSKRDVQALGCENASSIIKNIINKLRGKAVYNWFKLDTPTQVLDLITKMLQFNPHKRLSAEKLLKQPYFSSFKEYKEEKRTPKIVFPPVSDNKKLKIEKYRYLIYEKIQQIYDGENQGKKINKSADFHIKKFSSLSKASRFSKYEQKSANQQKNILKESRKDSNQKKMIEEKKTLKQILSKGTNLKKENSSPSTKFRNTSLKKFYKSSTKILNYKKNYPLKRFLKQII